MKARQKQSKFKFQPFSRHQKKVLTWWREGSPYKDYDGIIADGAIRSGKTIAFILGFVLWSTSTFTGQNFIISGKSIGTLKRNIVGPILLILRALGIQYAYNRSENFLAFSGNTYYLFGANNEASQDTLQGITAAGWLADEVALQPQSFIEQAFGRCSVESSKYWLNCNPENPRHYIKTEVIDKAKEKRFLHVHFALDDNLTLSEKIKNRYRRMFSGVWYKRFILGLWVAAEGAIYDMFDDSVHVVDKVPDIVRYWIAIDYGTTNPTTFLLIGQGADKRLYVCAEWRWDSTKQGSQKTDAQYSEELKRFVKKTGCLSRLQFIFIDPSAASFRLQAFNDHVNLRSKLAPANNDVLDGIRRISTLLSLNKLYILSCCIGLIQEMCSYTWDPKANERGEDVPIKQNDHGPDALRYAINGIRHIWEPWLRNAA